MKVYLDMILEVDSILKECKVPYWLAFGTVLGFHREGEVIKNDSDIDFDCYAKDLKKNFTRIARALKDKGYKVRHIKEYNKIKIAGRKGKIDIGIAGFRKRGKYRIRNKWRIPAKYFGNGTIEYEGQRFRCHSPIEGYLEWVYSNWKTPMKKKLGNRLYTKKVLR